MTSRSYDRNTEPEQFEAQCQENTAHHERVIQADYERLVKAGVPEKYIYVMQVNSGGGEGDLYAFNDKNRVDRQLNCVKRGATVVCSPDVFLFSVVDLRDRISIRTRLCDEYFEDALIDRMLATIEGRMLVFDRETEPDLFEEHCYLNERLHNNLIMIAKDCLIKKKQVEPQFIRVLKEWRDPTIMPRLNQLIEWNAWSQRDAAIREVRFTKQQVTYPDIYVFTCVDVREHK